MTPFSAIEGDNGFLNLAVCDSHLQTIGFLKKDERLVSLFQWRGRVSTRVGLMFHLYRSDIFGVATVKTNKIKIIGGSFWCPKVAVRRKKWKVIEGWSVCRGWEVADVIF